MLAYEKCYLVIVSDFQLYIIEYIAVNFDLISQTLHYFYICIRSLFLIYETEFILFLAVLENFVLPVGETAHT